MLSTIALFASARRHGNTGAILDRIAADLSFEVVDLSESNVSPYDYAHSNRGDGFEPLVNKILRYDQLIFAAPVYWYAVPPSMKTFIDRLNDLLEVPELRERGRQLRGKRAFVVATSGIDEISPAFISMFRDTFAYLGMDYRGHLHLNCDGGYIHRKGIGESEIEAFETLVREE
jgi:multimeric flavodoxin WrbA